MLMEYPQFELANHPEIPTHVLLSKDFSLGKKVQEMLTHFRNPAEHCAAPRRAEPTKQSTKNHLRTLKTQLIRPGNLQPPVKIMELWMERRSNPGQEEGDDEGKREAEKPPR